MALGEAIRHFEASTNEASLAEEERQEGPTADLITALGIGMVVASLPKLPSLPDLIGASAARRIRCLAPAGCGTKCGTDFQS
jgi:hypothetical protein